MEISARRGIRIGLKRYALVVNSGVRVGFLEIWFQNPKAAAYRTKQTKNKTETKPEQKRKEKEGEKEGECEKEREGESEYDSSTPNPSFDLTDDTAFKRLPVPFACNASVVRSLPSRMRLTW